MTGARREKKSRHDSGAPGDCVDKLLASIGDWLVGHGHVCDRSLFVLFMIHLPFLNLAAQHMECGEFSPLSAGDLSPSNG